MLLLVKGVGFEKICTVSGKYNVSRVVPRLYGWICKIIRPFSTTGEDGIVLVTIGNQPGRPQFDTHAWPILDACFITFMFSSSGDMKFVILVEDSDSAYCFD